MIHNDQNGQDVIRHPARLHSSLKTRCGRAQVVFIVILALAVIVLVLAFVLRDEGDAEKRPTGATSTSLSDTGGGKSGKPDDDSLAPIPDPDDPQYKKLKICIERYRAAIRATGRILPHEFEKLEKAKRELEEALEAFKGVGDKLVLLLLAEYENETNPARRAELLDLITRFCDEKTAKRLLGLYAKLSVPDRKALLKGLIARDLPGLAEAFETMIPREKDTAAKNNMMDYMLARESESSEMKSTLFDWFDNAHDAAFRIHILKALPRYGEDAVTRDFYETVLHSEKLSTRERMAAMYSFAHSHGADAVPAISKYADSEDFKTKASAIKALEYAGGDSALQILDDLARNDPDEKIRKRAADSAYRIRNPLPEIKPAILKPGSIGKNPSVKTQEKKQPLLPTENPK
jgi:hypothetical protein